MDVNEFWQENKRFVVTVASGAIVFVIGSMLVANFFGKELAQQTRAADSANSKLKGEPMFTSSDLEHALQQNAALEEAIAKLSKSVDFQARPRFRLDPTKGSPSNVYFACVSSVREELLRLAGRANLRLPEDLGLPALSPTRELEIVKYLEALDLIDRAVHLALDVGAERIDKIEIKLDSRLASRQGVGEIEKTRVLFTLSGKPSPLVAFLYASQGVTKEGELALTPLVIEKSDLVPARPPSEQANLEVTFCVVRLHPASGEATPQK